MQEKSVLELSPVDKLLYMYGISMEQLLGMIMDYSHGKEVITVREDGRKHINLPPYGDRA